MHIADPDTGNLGANAIVGGSAGIATGAAFAAEVPEDRTGGGLLLRRGRARPGPALRGDEPRAALEAAGDLRLREQRLQRIHALLGVDGRRRRGARRRRSACATETVDGQNVREVYTAASTYIERARKGEGPAFLQCNTYRYHGHHVGDIARAYYRPKAEEQEWVTERDPITLHGEWLMAQRRRRPRRARRDPGRARSPRWTPRWSSPSTRRIPDPSKVTRTSMPETATNGARADASATPSRRRSPRRCGAIPTSS